MFRKAYYKKNKLVTDFVRAESRKTTEEFALMSANWKKDHTAAYSTLDSDPGRAVQIAAIEAKSRGLFQSHPPVGKIPPLLTPLAMKRPSPTHPPFSLLAATKYKTTNLNFPVPLDTDTIATGFAATDEDDSMDEDEPIDSDAFTDSTESGDENLFAEQEARMAGRIKIAMDALAAQKET